MLQAALGRSFVPTDPYRALVQKRGLAIAIEALMREEAAVNHYASRGKKVISVDDRQTRAVLKMGVAEPVADILVEARPKHLIVAEVKSSDLDRALIQLGNTARRALSRYHNIVYKIYVRNPAPRGDAVDLRGGGYGFRAVRVLHAQFPANGSSTYTTLNASIKPFLEMGQQRNRLAHQNFAGFSMEKTAEEIFSLYTTALYLSRPYAASFALAPEWDEAKNRSHSAKHSLRSAVNKKSIKATCRGLIR